MNKVYRVHTGAVRVKNAALQFTNRFTVMVAATLAALSLTLIPLANAATETIVTPTNTQGWSTADTRPGGEVEYVIDATAPGSPNVGALQLTTDATTAAKAQYLKAADVPLADVTELSYQAKQNSASFAGGNASYQLPVCLLGLSEAAVTPTNPTGCMGFTTLVYEPYQNGVVVPMTWQEWDVDAGQMWSSRSVSSGTCMTTAGAGGPPFYTLAGLSAACPDAVVAGFGVNIGTFNPSYDVEVDLVNFNGDVYNFEPYQVVSSKDQCKKDGWKDLKAADGQGFKNQGACVSYVASNGASRH